MRKINMKLLGLFLVIFAMWSCDSSKEAENVEEQSIETEVLDEIDLQGTQIYKFDNTLLASHRRMKFLYL